VAPLVHRLGYVALNVADLRAAIDDAQKIAGATLVDETLERALLTSNQRNAELVLHRSEENSARCIGLEVMNAEAVDEIRTRVRKERLRLLSERPSLPSIERAVTFATSEGHVFEAHTPVPCDQPMRHQGPGIHPRFVDHVNLTAEDPTLISGELEKVLGLLLSERTNGYELMWLRAGDRRHHTVALVKGKTGLHHYSWEFAEFGDLKRLGDALDCEGRNLLWGPGRHGAGDNLFTYFIDRCGFMVECNLEMEIIHQDNWQPRVVEVGANLSNPKVVNRWGTPPPLAWIEHCSRFAAHENIGA
jgi:catechol 2,3-dioxygenase